MSDQELIEWYKRVFDEYPSVGLLAFIREVMEQAAPVSAWEVDWSTAPEWAMWWACDPAGWTCWFEQEPIMHLTDNYSGWVVKTVNGYQQGHDLEAQSIDLPLGIDWRQTLTQRPATAAGEEE